MSAQRSDLPPDPVTTTPDPAPDEGLPPPKPLLVLSEPLSPVVETPDALARVAGSVSAGTGPVAVDAERASGYRYSQRAYLLQLRREGAGTALVDPVAFDDLGPLVDALDDTEWVLHAASQDLPCLAEVGLRPARLFDTELAARLLDLPRVGLATLVEELLGARLAKEHSAVDWSTRPLPEPWLEYAALDVEVLIPLRDILAQRLTDSGKASWAAEEFEALTRFTAPERRSDPWRRTSGIHRVRGRRALAVVRELWEARDALAADLDVTPGRLLTDTAVVEAATAMPPGPQVTRSLPGMRHRRARRHVETWSEAVERARALPESALPPVSGPGDGLPPPRSWSERNPPAAARLAACRAVVTELCATYDLPAENLLPPESVRRLAWSPPQRLDPATVADLLRGFGARDWQVGLTAERFTAALRTTTPPGASGT